MLAIFESQLTNIDSELLTLQSRLAELKKIKKDLETKQSKASEALENLKALTSDLAGDAIENLKAAVLAIFPSASSENSSSAPQTEMFTDFVTVVPKMPTEEEIFDAECLPPASEPEPAPAIEVSAAENLPILNVIETVASAPEAYLEFVYVRDNKTLGYFKKTSDGEIGSIYLGCSSHRLANEWGKMITLWGGDVQQIRSAKRLNGEGIKYEVKFIKCDFDRILKIAKVHISPDSPVPTPPSEKKPEPAPAPTQQTNDSIGTGANSQENGNDASSESSSNEATKESSFLFYEPSNFDKIVPEWDAYTIAPDGKPEKLLGRVKKHLIHDTYQHSLMRGLDWQRLHFGTREDAAADMLKRKNADKALHDRTNEQLRKAAGF